MNLFLGWIAVVVIFLLWFNNGTAEESVYKHLYEHDTPYS